jgi:hypothetical protein
MANINELKQTLKQAATMARSYQPIVLSVVAVVAVLTALGMIVWVLSCCRRRYTKREQDLESGTIHPCRQEVPGNPHVWRNPDLMPLPRATLSTQPQNSGTPIGWWPTPPPKDDQRARQSSRSNEPLVREMKTFQSSVRADAERTSSRSTQNPGSSLSRQRSWPLRSVDSGTSASTNQDLAPKVSTASIRWPFLGHVRNDVVNADSLHISRTVESPTWDDMMDEGRPKVASECGSQGELRRYYADPGPRAPLPCDSYAGQERMASFAHRAFAAPNVLDLSPSTRKLV